MWTPSEGQSQDLIWTQYAQAVCTIYCHIHNWWIFSSIFAAGVSCYDSDKKQKWAVEDWRRTVFISTSCLEALYFEFQFLEVAAAPVLLIPVGYETVYKRLSHVLHWHFRGLFFLKLLSHIPSVWFSWMLQSSALLFSILLTARRDKSFQGVARDHMSALR